MKKYHFQENEKDFGSTVRLDAINDKVKEINAREKIIDYLSSEITDYLVEVNRYELPLADSRRIGALFHVVIDLERIGDHAINILENAEKSA